MNIIAMVINRIVFGYYINYEEKTSINIFEIKHNIIFRIFIWH
jgi:hypothetical protein